MLKKISHLFIVILITPSIKDRFRIIFHLLYSIIKLPAFIIHEVSHLILDVLFLLKIEKIVIPYFYDVDFENNKIHTYAMHIQVSFKDNKLAILAAILANMAPLFSTILLIVLFHNNKAVLIYMLISLKMLMPSSQDYHNAYNLFKLLIKSSQS